MKIGLLTYQNANNFGAALQAYALETFLSLNGFDCEYLNYICKSVERRYRSKNYLNPRTWMKKPMEIIREHSFSRFRTAISISRDIFSLNNIQTANQKYDCFLVGSDQVWNYKLNGNDTTFLLGFATKPCMSYASSLGLSEIEPQYVKQYIDCLGKFKSILVRESAAKNILEKLGIGPCSVVLDPCFLLDADCWSLRTKPVIQDDYSLYYTFDATNTKRFNTIFKKSIQNFRICKLGGGINICDYLSPRTIVKYTSGPDDFLSLIKNAKLVVTDSFHATVFSIIFKKPFVVFYRNRPGKDARIMELLKIANLTSREFSAIEPSTLFSFDSSQFSGEQLEAMRSFSKNMLLSSLERV